MVFKADAMRSMQKPGIVREGSWQTGSFAPLDFLADFLAGFISSFYMGKMPSEILHRNPCQTILQELYSKNPRHISADCPGQALLGQSEFRYEGW